MVTNRAGMVLQHLRKLTAVQVNNSLSDRELLDRFVAVRDEVAFEALVHRHGPMVLAVCRRVLANWHDAEDALQATFLVLARKAASARWRRSVGGWLYTVAHRLALRARAEAARRSAREGRAARRPEPDPLAEITLREAQAALDEELARLPERCRAPLVLCCLEGVSREAAARQLGWSLGTLKRRLEQGRLRLRSQLSRRGVVFSAGLFGLMLAEDVAPAAVPTAVAAATIRDALLFAAGEAGELASTPAVILAKGALRGMSLAKLKLAAAALLMLAVIGTVAGNFLQFSPNHTPRKFRDEAQGALDPRAARPISADHHGDPLPAGALARLGTVRFRHGSPVTSIAFSPDGKTLASGSLDWTVRLWDASTGEPLARLAGHQGWVCCVAFSPDGKTLASGGDERDPTIYLWDTAAPTAKKRGRLVGHQGPLRDLAFSPDSQTLASASSDQTLRLWDVVSGKELLRVSHPEEARTVAFSPDGCRLASAGADGTVRLWDPVAGRALQQMHGHQAVVVSIVFSPDGRTLLSGGEDKTIRLWETATGKESRRLAGAPGGVATLSLSVDGTLLAVGDRSGKIVLRDLDADRELCRYGGHEGGVRAIAFAPDGRTLASGGDDNRVHVWDRVTAQEILPCDGHRSKVTCVAFAPDGKVLATAGADRTIRLWDAATRKELRTLEGHQAHVSTLTFAADGRVLASGSWDKSIRLWDVATGREVRRLEGHQGGIVALAFSPDGKALVSGGVDQMVGVWPIAPGPAPRWLPGAGGRAECLALSADGRTLAVASADGTVRLLEVASGKELGRVQRPGGPVAALTFSPDGRMLAMGDGKPQAEGKPFDAGAFSAKTYLWEVGAAGPDREFEERHHRVLALAFSPDGRFLAVGTSGRTVRVRDVVTGEEVGEFYGHQGYVRSLAFAPDGRTLVSVSEDTTALLWDVSGLGPAKRP